MGQTRRTASAVARLRGEEGFTIMESIVGLVLFVVLFTTAATTLQLSIRNQREARSRQQAVAIATAQIEDARSMSWSGLALTSSPPMSDPNVKGSVVLGSSFNLPGDETLVIDAKNGEVEPWIEDAETLDNQSFDLHQYVTASADGVRRVIVVVEWVSSGAGVENAKGVRTEMTHQGVYVATTQMAEVTQ
jgi:type II secretory pathway pseudopilin PulG